MQKEFDKIQKSLKSHGYQAKSVNDIYHDARKSYYYVVVDGGKRIIILEDSYGRSLIQVISKEKTNSNHDTSSR